MALGLAEAGADVVAVDVLGLEETMSEVEARGRRAHGMELDLGVLRADGARELVAEAAGALGGLHVLVNNAGIIRRHPALAFPEGDWAAVIGLNLTSAFLLSQATAGHFMAAGQGGKVINMASMLSFQGGFEVAAYTAAKSGLAGLTRALANEWAPHGINVNAVAPGYMATELTSALRAEAASEQAMRARMPAGRWGQPEDLQGAVVYLASAAADYVHGAVVPVDGGWLAR